MINEKEVKVFIDGSKRYFDTSTDRAVKVRAPYLVDMKELPASDYTGIIGVSGNRKGCVYFSSPKAMLRHLLLSLGEATATPELMQDIVGEVANTISGNAREEFGQDFMISVPIVVEGKPQSIHLPGHLKAFMVPLVWQGYTASLVVCLE